MHEDLPSPTTRCKERTSQYWCSPLRLHFRPQLLFSLTLSYFDRRSILLETPEAKNFIGAKFKLLSLILAYSL